MNLKQFTVDAKRTESVPDTVSLNPVIFEQLRTSVVHLMDCFDLIKKNVFYGKEIDTARFAARLTITENIIGSLKTTCLNDPTYINSSVDVALEPRVFHGILGIITEAGELLELVDNTMSPSIDPLKIADELGDLFWYIAVLADAKGIDIEEQILEGVIAKLRKRFPDKFDAALAVVRDKEAEFAETSAVTGIADEAAKAKPVNKGGRPRKKPAPLTEGNTKSNTKGATRKAGTKPKAPPAPQPSPDAAGGEDFV